jgi:hypothetical protein
MEDTSTPNGDSPVLVVVVNDPTDLARAQREGWYRIPLARAPARVAAEWLAFYMTGAFPAGERWAVRWLAPVRGYRLAPRRELIPTEPWHPRAGDLYYRVTLGPLEPIDPPIPSRRLRRITFIPTTLARLHEASEINDLWIKSSAQERLWNALKGAEIEAERQYPLRDDDYDQAEHSPSPLADFALFGPAGRVAIIVEDERSDEVEVRETQMLDYLLVARNWLALRVTREQLGADPGGLLQRASALAGIKRVK